MADVREVSSLPLSASVIASLIRAGYRTVADLKDLEPLDLVQDLRITPDLALQVLQCAQSCFSDKSTDNSTSVSAKDILSRHGGNRPVITFCRSIDQLLGGGVPLGQITEFCGVPGVGKTQMAIQLALNVQIPEVFNGRSGEAVYIDTEGSFMVERAAEMASELHSHLIKLSKSNANKVKAQEVYLGQLTAAENMTVERFLEGIQTFRVHDQVELIATIHQLSSFLKSHTKVKMIIIDSIAFHFRQDLNDTSARSRMLSSIAQILNKLAYDFNLGVVLINHVTTRVEKGSMGQAGGNKLVPALGEQWSHCVTNRIMLHWASTDNSMSTLSKDNQRHATLLKSPSMPNASVQYCVNQKGIRDVPVSLVNQDQVNKRRRMDNS